MLLRIAAESPKTAGVSLREKWIVGLLIVVLVPVNLIGGFLWFHLPRGVSPEFQVLIDRQTESEAEWLALAAAEGVNYSLILQRPPFWNSNDTWVPNLEGETWINYISNQTVTHLLDRVDYHRQRGSQVRIDLDYTANCFWVSNLSLEVVTDGLRAYNGTNEWVVHGSAYSHLWGSRCAIRVNDTYQLSMGGGYMSEVRGTYGDVFFVSMHVHYEEYWGPLGAYYIGFDQFVILSGTREVLMLLALDAGHMVA
jgi:hypothetical protein